MADLPLLVSAPMVLALLAGKKTMTRRLAEGKPRGIGSDEILVYGERGYRVSEPLDSDDGPDHLAYPPSPWQKVKRGDRLWVREAWLSAKRLDDLKPNDIAQRAREAGYDPPWAPVVYLADRRRVNFEGEFHGAEPGERRRAAMHMPRWASRLTLEVTRDARVEQLQAISEEDAAAEGCLRTYPFTEDDTARKDFRRLWDTLHGRGAWDRNPEVVVLRFWMREGNIDLLDRAA